MHTTLTRAQWRDVVASAISAPSVLNTQPWSFIIRDNRVELHADKDRQLQVIDPHGRQLLMSCGAALLNLPHRRPQRRGAFDDVLREGRRSV